MRPELTPEKGSPSRVDKATAARRRAWLHTPDEPETLWRVVEVARDDDAARLTVDDGAGAPFEVDVERLTDYDATFEAESLCADLSNLASRAAREWSLDIVDVRIPKKDTRGLSESVPTSYLQAYKSTATSSVVVADAPSGANEVRSWARLEAFLKKKDLEAILKDLDAEPSLARSKLEASVQKCTLAKTPVTVVRAHPQTWIACAAGDKQRRLYARAMGRPDVRRALARKATRSDEAKAVAAALRVLRLATNGDVQSCEAALDGTEDRFDALPQRELGTLLETSTKLEALRSLIKSATKAKKKCCVLAAQPEALDLCEEALRERRKTLGDRHRTTLISINNMGLLLKNMGKLVEARPLYDRPGARVLGWRVKTLRPTLQRDSRL